MKTVLAIIAGAVVVLVGGYSILKPLRHSDSPTIQHDTSQMFETRVVVEDSTLKVVDTAGNQWGSNELILARDETDCPAEGLLVLEQVGQSTVVIEYGACSGWDIINEKYRFELSYDDHKVYFSDLQLTYSDRRQEEQDRTFRISHQEVGPLELREVDPDKLYTQAVN